MVHWKNMPDAAGMVSARRGINFSSSVFSMIRMEETLKGPYQEVTGRMQTINKHLCALQ